MLCILFGRIKSDTNIYLPTHVTNVYQTVGLLYENAHYYVVFLSLNILLCYFNISGKGNPATPHSVNVSVLNMFINKYIIWLYSRL